jgi:SAM-dependent methyltransferase
MNREGNSRISRETADGLQAKNLSHKQSGDSFSKIIENKKEKIISRRHLHSYATVDYQLELLEQLTQFDLGRFLLEQGGLNGFWTDYAIRHPSVGRLSGVNNESKPFSSLESFLLNRAPTALATQQCFEIVKKEIQKFIADGITFASIPCGLMADLLELDYSNVSKFSLVGIDVDLESFKRAEHVAKEKKLFNHCEFIAKDAWDLKIDNEFDLITSHGLNIYESSEERVVSLYRQFFNALKPQGRLITSFLTPPPGLQIKTEWNLDKVHLPDAQLQKLLFVDILEGKWQFFRSAEQSTQQLKNAGFIDIEIIYDEAHIFPTIVAIKPKLINS